MFRAQRDRSFNFSKRLLKTLSLRKEEEDEGLRYLAQLDAQAADNVLLPDQTHESDDSEDSDEEFILDPEDEPQQTASSTRNYMDMGPIGDLLEATTVSGREATVLFSSYEVAKQRSNGADVIDVSQLVSHSKVHYTRVQVSVRVRVLYSFIGILITLSVAYLILNTDIINEIKTARHAVSRRSTRLRDQEWGIRRRKRRWQRPPAKPRMTCCPCLCCAGSWVRARPP